MKNKIVCIKGFEFYTNIYEYGKIYNGFHSNDDFYGILDDTGIVLFYTDSSYFITIEEW